MRLSAGRGAVEVDAAIGALAVRRCADLERFQLEGGRPEVTLRLEGPAAEAPAGARPLGAAGAYAVAGDEVRVWLPEDPLAAEASVRLAYAVAFDRQGGLLLHAAGIAFPGGSGAWLAVGPSGCGKSTLAQRCADAGAEVLSDETVGFLPDGSVWATPFRSSARFARPARPPPPRPLAVLTFPEHGSAERLEPLGPADAVKRLLPQIYRTPGAPLLHRAATLATWRGVGRFWFRDDPAVAGFVKQALLG